jgi:hypothetical protein
VNSYEVVFKDIAPVGTEAAYYRGTGTNKDSSLKVWVLPGKRYEVLLLAGKGNILLAAGYKGPKAANQAKDGLVEIKKGEANTVAISLTPIPLQWNSASTVDNKISTTGTINHFEFGASLTDSSAYSTGIDQIKIADRYVNLAPTDTKQQPPTYGADRIKRDTDKFTVNVSLAGLTPLIRADPATALDSSDSTKFSTQKLTIAAARVRLWPRYLKENFNPVDLVTSTALTSGVDTTNPIAFVNAPATAPLPNWDVDTVLQCDLKYYAFGTALSEGTPWIIRNGIDATEDDTPSGETPNKSTIGSGTGGFIVVKIGQGSPEELQEVTVIPSWW